MALLNQLFYNKTNVLCLSEFYKNIYNEFDNKLKGVYKNGL